MQQRRWKWLNHRGKTILWVDYHDLKPNEILPLMKETNDAVAASVGSVVILGIVTDATVTKEIMEYLRRSTTMVLRQRAKKIAVVGATGLMSVFFESFAVNLDKDVARKFSTEEEALKWLAE